MSLYGVSMSDCVLYQFVSFIVTCLYILLEENKDYYYYYYYYYIQSITFIQYVHSSVAIRYFLITGQLSGVSSRALNSGLLYNKPTHYHLS
jgi:hypothetical protein